MVVVDATSLEEALAALNRPSTSWLIANGRNFGDFETIALSQALRQNKTLSELSLAGNSIGPDGAAALGCAVGGHPTLRELYVQKNTIGPVGFERMARGIMSCGGAPGLRILNASDNAIGPTIPPDIALPCLVSLQLSRNSIEEVPVALAECPSLHEVALDDNPLVPVQLELYNQGEWAALKQPLAVALQSQRHRNGGRGFGMVTDRQLEERLRMPVRDALLDCDLHAADRKSVV